MQPFHRISRLIIKLSNPMKKVNLNRVAFFATLILILITGCEKWFHADSRGQLVISITDDPFNIDLVESATVTIESMEVRHKGVNDTVPFIKIMETPVTVDLMDLRNGVTQELVHANLPAGDYDQVRLITGEASVKIKDGDLFTLKVPSGAQSGIKIKVDPSVTVEGGLTSSLLLDFDLSKSFVLRGNTNKPNGIVGLNFKPVVRVANISFAGSVEGKVTDIEQNFLENASVLVLKDTVLASSFTDASGKYLFIGIPAGTYKMIAAKESYDTLVFEGVKVVAGNVTIRNFALKKE